MSFSAICHLGSSQTTNTKILYIVDSIPVINDPEQGDDIGQNDIADVKVIKNKDTLKLLGYTQFDGVMYVFTKEYRSRPDSIKGIPSSKQMERKNNQWLLKGVPFSGAFIDYYYSGKKQGEGWFLNGRLNGVHTMYYKNGKPSVIRNYTDGIANGIEKQYYEDGSLQQEGRFVDGKEKGIWAMYYPNGQLKQRNNFIGGQMEGQDTAYYSTGKILAIEITKNGKTAPDKRLEKIRGVMGKGHDSYKEEDYQGAIKYYTKAIGMDSTYAEAYFARGSIKLDDLQFDGAIADFDLALHYEPFMAKALSNRAFARIRKYQFGNSRVLSKNSGVTVLASKDKVTVPDEEKIKICHDLQQAIFLGEKSTMLTEAVADYCQGGGGK